MHAYVKQKIHFLNSRPNRLHASEKPSFQDIKRKAQNLIVPVNCGREQRVGTQHTSSDQSIFVICSWTDHAYPIVHSYTFNKKFGLVGAPVLLPHIPRTNKRALRCLIQMPRMINHTTQGDANPRFNRTSRRVRHSLPDFLLLILFSITGKLR